MSRPGCQFGVPGGTYAPKKYPCAPPGPGSRLLNRNRLLADPNLDLGLDRVGDQRREIYYVVRRKEGRVFGETTGSPLWHGRLSFSLDFRPSVMHQCQDQLNCLICYERKHKNNRRSISYIFAFCIHERDLNSGTLSLHSYTAPFVNTVSSTKTAKKDWKCFACSSWWLWPFSWPLPTELRRTILQIR